MQLWHLFQIRSCYDCHLWLWHKMFVIKIISFSWTASHVQNINLSKLTAVTRQKKWKKSYFTTKEFPAEPFLLLRQTCEMPYFSHRLSMFWLDVHFYFAYCGTKMILCSWFLCLIYDVTCPPEATDNWRMYAKSVYNLKYLLSKCPISNVSVFLWPHPPFFM